MTLRSKCGQKTCQQQIRSSALCVQICQSSRRINTTRKSPWIQLEPHTIPVQWQSCLWWICPRRKMKLEQFLRTRFLRESATQQLNKCSPQSLLMRKMTMMIPTIFKVTLPSVSLDASLVCSSCCSSSSSLTGFVPQKKISMSFLHPNGTSTPWFLSFCVQHCPRHHLGTTGGPFQLPLLSPGKQERMVILERKAAKTVRVIEESGNTLKPLAMLQRCQLSWCKWHPWQAM